MNANRDRLGRTEQQRGQRLGRRAWGGRALGAAGAAMLALVLGSGSALAMTGGAAAPVGDQEDTTARASFSKMRLGGATWYGPGLYGNRTACGQVLRPHTIGVAHRTLPCGTAVMFVHRGRSVVAPVIDRGPFVAGIRWDLTNGVRLALGFEGSGKVHYAIARGAVVSERRLRRRSGRGTG